MQKNGVCILTSIFNICCEFLNLGIYLLVTVNDTTILESYVIRNSVTESIFVFIK